MSRRQEPEREVWMVIASAAAFATLATGLAVAARHFDSPSIFLGVLPLLGGVMGAVLGWLAAGKPLP